MKKTFLGICAIAAASLFLTSCLGDGNGTTYQGNRDFGVINTANGVKYAALGSGLGGVYVTWDGISSYNTGDAVLLTYKVDASNLVAGTSIMIAEYGNVADGEKFPESSQKTVTPETIDTVANAKTAFFKGFNLDKYSSNTFFSDKWLVDYTADKKDGDVLSISFHYDANKQKQKGGADLPEKTVIVDVVLSKSNTAPEGAATVTDSNKMLVIKMDELRRVLRSSVVDENGIGNVGIWFRLKRENKNVTSGYDWVYYQNAGNLLYDKQID